MKMSAKHLGVCATIVMVALVAVLAGVGAGVGVVALLTLVDRTHVRYIGAVD